MKKLVAMFLACLSAVALAIAPTTEVAPRNPNNVIISAFNIIHFSDYRQNIPLVAKVVANFDLCGIVEMESIPAMHLLKGKLDEITGVKWEFIVGEETGGRTKRERFAYIWRTDRVRISGDAYNFKDDGSYNNEPYVASFKSGNFDFITVLVHLIWWPANKKANEARNLATMLSTMGAFEKDIIVMGDFNLNHDAPDLEPVKKVPGIKLIEPVGVLTRVLKDGSMGEENIDYIFIFDSTSEWTGESGAYNFVPVAYPNPSDRKRAILELSDHLPVWAAFHTDRPDDD